MVGIYATAAAVHACTHFIPQELHGMAAWSYFEKGGGRRYNEGLISSSRVFSQDENQNGALGCPCLLPQLAF